MGISDDLVVSVRVYIERTANFGYGTKKNSKQICLHSQQIRPVAPLMAMTENLSSDEYDTLLEPPISITSDSGGPECSSTLVLMIQLYMH